MREYSQVQVAVAVNYRKSVTTYVRSYRIQATGKLVSSLLAFIGTALDSQVETPTNTVKVSMSKSLS